MIFHFVKSEIRRQMPPYLRFSLLTEGFAVSTLVSSGIGLMGTNQDPLQAAEVRILAMMGALLHGTLNALVCMTIHSVSPPSSRDEIRLPPCVKNIHFSHADD